MESSKVEFGRWHTHKQKLKKLNHTDQSPTESLSATSMNILFVALIFIIDYFCNSFVFKYILDNFLYISSNNIHIQ